MSEPAPLKKKPAAPGAEQTATSEQGNAPADAQEKQAQPRELGGPTGPDPTRYGDWERKGRCIDF